MSKDPKVFPLFRNSTKCLCFIFLKAKTAKNNRELLSYLEKKVNVVSSQAPYLKKYVKNENHVACSQFIKIILK